MTFDDLHEAQRNSSIIDALCIAMKRPQDELVDAVKNLKAEIETMRAEVAKLKEKR